MEYPFALADALAYKFSYRDADASSATTAYVAGAHKLSLHDSGVLDQPSCKLLLINGIEDSIFPIEDNFVVGVRGDHKDVVARGNRGHMGPWSRKCPVRLDRQRCCGKALIRASAAER